MAIIRIKRTTSSSLPTGLTFGELAFVGASGGATANRLYIAGPEGTCLWIGAQILKTPQIQYWSGVTAQTTLASIAAIEDRMVAGGAITFSGPLAVNIDTGKYFGKYTKGDTIEATGKTVKEVIEMALSESINPTVSVSFNDVSQIPYGQTSGINYTVTASYTINTVGSTAAGATLEWRRSGESSWNTYPGTFYDTSFPFNTNGQPFTNSAVTGITLNPLSGGVPDTRDFQWRFSVHDWAGASATSTTQPKIVQDSASATISLSVTNNDIVSPETNLTREKGRVQSTLTGTISRPNQYTPITDWKIQRRENMGGWVDVNSFQSVSGNPPSINIGSIVDNPTNTVNIVTYRGLVKTAYDTVGQVTAEGGNVAVVFYYKLFYGATASQPTTASQIRTMPNSYLVYGGSYSNPFIFLTGSAYTNFVIALPTNVDLSDQKNLDAFGDSPGFVKSSTITTAIDAAGNSKNYNVWQLTTGVTFGDGAGVSPGQGNRFEITTTGTVA
jgi:hypothetical protein